MKRSAGKLAPRRLVAEAERAGGNFCFSNLAQLHGLFGSWSQAASSLSSKKLRPVVQGFGMRFVGTWLQGGSKTSFLQLT